MQADLANLEVDDIKQKALEHKAKAGKFPGSSDELSPTSDAVYSLDMITGEITSATSGRGVTLGLTFNAASQEWVV